jgi:hypothetical protein
MTVGKVYKIVLPTQRLDLIVKDIRRLRVPLRESEVFYIESVPAKYKIWLSCDKNKTPLRIQGLISVGSVYLAATNVEVKNPS